MFLFVLFFFFQQKTAYELRISDWSSDVCSSDLAGGERERSTSGRCPRPPRRLRARPRRQFPGRVGEIGGHRRRARSGPVDRRTTRREIGRASCRGRVCQYGLISVVAVYSKKNKTHKYITALNAIRINQL